MRAKPRTERPGPSKPPADPEWTPCNSSQFCAADLKIMDHTGHTEESLDLKYQPKWTLFQRVSLRVEGKKISRLSFDVIERRS